MKKKPQPAQETTASYNVRYKVSYTVSNYIISHGLNFKVKKNQNWWSHKIQ